MKESRKSLAIFTVFATLATATMVNAPGIFVGYGLVYVVMLLAAWLFKPKYAFTAVLLSSLLAIPLLILPRAVFLEVAILSAIVRPPVTYIAAYVRWRSGLLPSALSLTALESLAALTIAVLYYGNDGIHVSLAIFGVCFAPFAYLVYASVNRGLLQVIAGVAVVLGYFLSLYALAALILLAASVAAASLLAWRRTSSVAVAAILVIAVGFSASSAAHINAKMAFYPFEPSSWTEERWQRSGGACSPSQNVFENTHTPERLRIAAMCVEIVGEVAAPPFIPEDGDYCFDILPEGEGKYLLGIGNYLLRKSALHVEVVPADQAEVLRTGLCPGDVVRVRGVWVVDTDHGMWTEVHPAEEVEILQRADCPPGLRKMVEGLPVTAE